MTGFGSATARDEELEVSVSARSLNHRFLDVSVHLPRRLAGLEPELRKAAQARVGRGKLELSVTARFASGGPDGVRAVEPVVASLVAALRALKETHRLAGDISVSDIARFPGALEPPEASAEPGEAARRRVLELLAGALDQLDAMRRAEGERLREALHACLDELLGGVERVERLAADGRGQRLAALAEKLRDLAAGAGLDEARLCQEAVRLVDRSDVSEELVRLRSHVAQCRQALDAGGSSGKRLDFLAQELAREANTVGSKAVSAAVAQEAVSLKAVIERFREQVQNVE